MMKTIELSNPRYNADGSIDADWNHPVHGQIAFTASPNDPEPHGRAIFEWLQNGEYGPVLPYNPPIE